MGMQYTGGGFLPNIPARDLTDDEVEAYGGEALLAKSGIYRTDYSEAKVRSKQREAKITGPSENKSDDGSTIGEV